MTIAENPSGKSSTKGEAQSKFKLALARFEDSVKEMQQCMKELNETITEHYSESLPRAKEFELALQDENTLVENFVNDTHDVEDLVRRYSKKFGDVEKEKVSEKKSNEFSSSVLGTVFKAQNVFFSESCKVSQVLVDIVTQGVHQPTPREIRVNRELKEKLEPEKGHKLKRGGGPPAAMAVSPYAADGATHRGPGALVGGSFGSKTPKSKGSVKPASRFSTPPSKVSAAQRIFI